MFAKVCVCFLVCILSFSQTVLGAEEFDFAASSAAMEEDPLGFLIRALVLVLILPLAFSAAGSAFGAAKSYIQDRLNGTGTSQERERELARQQSQARAEKSAFQRGVDFAESALMAAEVGVKAAVSAGMWAGEKIGRAGRWLKGKVKSGFNRLRGIDEDEE